MIIHPSLIAAIAALGSVLGLGAAQDAMDAGDPMSGMGGMVGSDDFASADVMFFESKIRPLLISACSGCHSDNGSRIRAGFEIDTRAAMMRGGDTGPGVVPGDPDASLLIHAVRYDDPMLQMPPRGRLAAEEIRLLERWVEMGAPMPEPRGHAVADAAPGTEFRWSDQDIEQGRSHWAYRPIRNVPSPPDETEWARGDIDRFVVADLENRGRGPTRDASDEIWLRRVTFDITGLAPTLEERKAFLSDRRSGARERVVDRLLASDAYGERWGRHWLDVARYAESSGKETNVVYPHAWRYRDWVISAFNQDLPYDQFVTKQIAGDLLPARDRSDEAENLIATGYLAIGSKSHSTRGRAQFVLDMVDEQIDTTTKGLLATTVACARCHDHKFDPIPQVDYYALAGIFASTDTRFGSVPTGQNRQTSELISLPEDASVSEGPPLSGEIRAFAERMRADAQRQIDAAEDIRSQMRRSGRRGASARNQLSADQQQVLVRARRSEGRLLTADSILSRFDEAGRPTAANLACMGAVEGDIRDVPFLERGEIDGAGDVVPRGFPRLLSSETSSPTFDGRSGRLELARWITADDHPLTSRVWANRIWLHLFGRGIVDTPDNFGLSGRTPSNSALLDHLATRLMEVGWSTKSMVKEIVLSRTYGLDSSPPDGTQFAASNEIDVLTHGFMPRRRLEAEAIRDAMLQIAGVLERRPPSGSSASTLEGVLAPRQVDRMINASIDRYLDHRSVYLPIVRNALPKSLEVFDFPEPEFVVGDRDETNVATQALYLMNAERVQDLAKSFAARVIESDLRQTDRIRSVFQLAYGRDPSGYEIRACREFLRGIGDAHAEDRERQAVNDAPRDRRRRPFQRRRDGNERRDGRFDSIDHELIAWSSLCQTIIQASEFRTLD